MKLPDIYTDWKIVVGLALVVLGAGNWVLGLERTQLTAGWSPRARIPRQQPTMAVSTSWKLAPAA